MKQLYCLSQNIPGGYVWTKSNHILGLGYEMRGDGIVWLVSRREATVYTEYGTN